MEKLLLQWINEKQLARDTITETIVCEKAGALYGDLLKKSPGTSTEETSADAFKVSRGWFDNFKKRTGYEKQCALTRKKLKISCVNPSAHCSQGVHRTIGIQLGDLKIKLFLVYHSENLRTFKSYKILKEKQQVMWRANIKTWVTRQFFSEWVNLVFGPGVKKYLLENSLPLKALLILDNAPAPPSSLEDDILDEFKFIKVLYLSRNTTPILQPMDQQVISNFKKLYTKNLFSLCFEVTENTSLTLREFLKKHYNIVNCLKIIDMAWQDVTRRTLNSAWRKLWPDCVSERDFEEFKFETPVVEEIASLGKSMSLEVDDEDINDLVEEYSEKLTTNELLQLQKQQYLDAVEEIGSPEEDSVAENAISARDIKAVLTK
ncbi:tigger transposable element-derived protein 1-like [Octopus bimaculoides]|uniref:tigger transposable element-derived protein 1-like n=1 Tax=Octopus bimaculoides TaxID=37653 RepID=UPI00071CD643|nr:tigger transposable element-derived protein 1-like [Octopus bimaculoides]|eukprot:XP_014790984.1 PREDICTED: tigger transposable element-derived protein 1-like [Octopus bimaculoides]